MGLDSVELVISIEKHFAITVSDGEAEKAMTVQDVADLVAKHRPVVPDPRDIRNEIRERLTMSLDPDPGPNKDEKPFADVCNGRTPSEVWAIWKAAGLKMPDLPACDQPDRKRNSLLGFLAPKWATGRSVKDLAFGRVLDAIVAHNHQQLIDPLRPRSRYEILMAVIGVSSDSLGVPELEMRPTDSYTNDLGVD